MTDIFLLLSYGGPDSLSAVRPFLERIAKGRSIPKERLKTVEKHYALFDGKSPINGEADNFCQQLKKFFTVERKTSSLAYYWGNLFAPPLLYDVLSKIIEETKKTLSETQSPSITLRVMNATPFSGSFYHERYKNALNEAIKQINQEREFSRDVPISWNISFMEPFANHPLYIRAVADTILDVRAEMILEMGTHLFNGVHSGPLILFTAHALPEQVARDSHYFDQIANLCRKVVQHLPVGKEQIKLSDISHSHPWDWMIAFHSRSGVPQTPWTGPTVEEVIQGIISTGTSIDGVLIVPVGFFFENMEILYDLDTETAQLCRNLSLNYRRAPLASTRRESLQMVADFLKNNL